MKATKAVMTTESVSLVLYYENASGLPVPAVADVRRWIEAVMENVDKKEVELSLRVVDRSESTQLNLQYRGKNAPTNVLSFPADIPKDIGSPLLGDLAICAQMVIAEAAEQNKAVTAHWAHMVIHGCLHLLGYDHQTNTQALQMEQIEIKLLAEFGIADPYTETMEG